MTIDKKNKLYKRKIEVENPTRKGFVYGDHQELYCYTGQ